MLADIRTRVNLKGHKDRRGYKQEYVPLVKYKITESQHHLRHKRHLRAHFLEHTGKLRYYHDRHYHHDRKGHYDDNYRVDHRFFDEA